MYISDFCRLKQEKRAKTRRFSSSTICTWNQHVIFSDINTIDNVLLWVKLINLEHKQGVLGELKLKIN